MNEWLIIDEKNNMEAIRMHILIPISKYRRQIEQDGSSSTFTLQ